MSLSSRLNRCLQLGAAMGLLAFAGLLSAQEKVTYTDHVLPLIENHCAKCHNPDKKKGDLDLTSYSGVLKGGGSGAVVIAGQPDSSKLWKALAHAEEPTMPPNKPPLPEKELAMVRKWIAGGLLETSSSKAIAGAKPTVDLSVKISSVGKPEGPPPMPGALPLEPVVHTARGNPISGLAASPWSPLVAIAGQKQVLLYNTTNLDLLGILPFRDGQPWDLKFSRSGRLLLGAGGHGARAGKVVLWNIETGERLSTLGREYDTVLAADVSPDQSRVALGGPDRLVKVYSTATSELEHKIKKHTDWVTALVFSPNGELLVSGDRNGGLSLWDPGSGQEMFTTAGHRAGVTAVSWRGDSKVVASASEDGAVKLWDAGEGKQVRTWNAHPGGVLGLAMAHDGRLVTCGRDGVVATWDASGNKLKSFDFFGDTPVRCAFASDGARIIAADFAGRVAVWDAGSGRRLGQLEANPLSLAEQISAARQRIAALESGTAQPAAEVAAFAASVATLTSELEKARTAADRARSDFAAKAREVVRLKELAAKPDAPAEVAGQLASARAAREEVRPVNTAAAAALEQAVARHASEQEKLDRLRTAHDPQAELAATRSRLQRLVLAQSQSVLCAARETLTEKKRALEQAQAQGDEARKRLQQLTQDLAGKEPEAADRLKEAITTATAELKSAESAATRAAAELAAEEARVRALHAEHLKKAGTVPTQQSKLQ